MIFFTYSRLLLSRLGHMPGIRVLPKPEDYFTSATFFYLLSLSFVREAECFAWHHFATCPMHCLVVPTCVRRASRGPTASHILSEHSSALLPRRRLALRVSCGYYRIEQQLWATIDRVARGAAVSSLRCGDRGTIDPVTAGHLA